MQRERVPHWPQRLPQKTLHFPSMLNFISTCYVQMISLHFAAPHIDSLAPPRDPLLPGPPSASGLVSAWRSASNGLVIIINGKTFSNLKLSNLILSPGHKPAACCPSLPPFPLPTSTHTHNGFALIVLGHSRLAVPFMAIVPALQRQRPLRRRLCGWLHQLSCRHTWRMSDKAAAAAGAAAAATR